MKKYSELILPIVIIFVSGILIYLSEKIEVIKLIRGQALGPRFFPRTVSIILIFLCMVLIISNIRKINVSSKSIENKKMNVSIEYNNVIFFSIFLIIYVFSISYLGFFPSTFFYLLATLWFFSKRTLKTFFLSIIVSFLFIGVIFLFFVKVLGVILPDGVFF